MKAFVKYIKAVPFVISFGIILSEKISNNLSDLLYKKIFIDFYKIEYSGFETELLKIKILTICQILSLVFLVFFIYPYFFKNNNLLILKKNKIYLAFVYIYLLFPNFVYYYVAVDELWVNNYALISVGFIASILNAFFLLQCFLCFGATFVICFFSDCLSISSFCNDSLGKICW